MDLNQQNVKKIKEIIVFTILLFILFLNYEKVFHVVRILFHMIAPFLLGGAIAFILNVPMRFVEGILPQKGSAQKWKRPFSLAAAILFVITILCIVIFVVFPEVGSTIATLSSSIPVFFMTVQKWAEELFAAYPDLSQQIAGLEFDWNKIIEGIVDFLRVGAGTMLNSTVSAARSIISAVTTLSVAFIFSIYILLQKENLARQFSRLLQAYLPKYTKQIIRIARLTEKTFSKFLAGQCMEAVILGSMFFIVLTVFHLPYALLIGVLIAFTALIPIFGAFLGCAVGIFLMLMTNPINALWFVIIFFVLQQIEGNLIYPHVVGNSVNLPSIWVLVAVTLGGSMMGVIGMLVFIPLCSVCYALLKEDVGSRIQEQKEENMTGKKKEKQRGNAER